MKKRIRYIINPKSGTKGKEEIPSVIRKLTDKNVADLEIVETKFAGHATELSKEASEQGYNIVVAVGGDGSVNEAAKGLVGSNTALGIIPTGSGNGLARHLHIPLELKAAIKTINGSKKTMIDTLQINEEICVGTFGTGFDGHIAHLFSNAGKRGYSTYIKLVLSEFYKYKSKVYEFTVDGKAFSRECFLLTFANSSQFGNNALIAPMADTQDGILDVSIIRQFPAISALSLIYHLMKGTIHHSKYFEMLKGCEVVVKNSSTLQCHIDGEPVTFNSDLNVKVMPKSLNIIVP